MISKNSFNDNMLFHSRTVGRICEIVMRKLHPNDERLCNDAFIVGYLHDIAKEYDIENHAVVGGEILKDLGFKYWREIYYHDNLDGIYSSEMLDVLRYADLHCVKDQIVSYKDRQEDIKSRYGEDSKVYEHCILMGQDLIDRGYTDALLVEI